jgi:4-carboxymuconolactone decarboxylase
MAGLAGGIIETIARKGAPVREGDEATVYAFCTEAHASGRVSDAAFDAVRQRFGLDGALELLALCGYYSLMAMVLNTAGLPLPDNAPPPLAP